MWVNQNWSSKLSKPKVLYVAPIRDLTGYCQAAIHTILGLDAAGVDVVPACVKLTSQSGEPPERLLELEKKSTEGITHIIQNLLPNCMIYKGGAKNIGYFYCETSNFSSSAWQYNLNLMDEVWVSCPDNAIAAKDSGVTKPIKVVPIPCDTNKFQTKSLPLTNLQTGNPYLFYFIGDFSYRKNITDVVRAYFTQFTRRDNVKLVLKTYCDGMSSQESTDKIKQEIELIKKNMRMHTSDSLYPEVIIITGYLSVETIERLHATCHCYVSAERGAAWNIPAFEAMAYGNWVIANSYGGQTQFLNAQNSNLVRATPSQVYGMGHCGYQGVYSGTEMWADPSLFQIGQQMKIAYDNKRMGLPINIDSKWNYANAGKVLADAL